MDIWSRVISIRWRNFARKLNILKRVCWRYAYRLRRYVYRLIVDKRIKREMAIWSQVVTRLEENLRRSRWRIIARKMKRFAGVCLIHSYLRTNPRRVAPLFEDDWPAGRTPPLEPWGDYNWDANIALADFDAMPQDDHFGQDTAPCSTSAPGSASAAEPSLDSMDEAKALPLVE